MFLLRGLRTSDDRQRPRNPSAWPRGRSSTPFTPHTSGVDHHAPGSGNEAFAAHARAVRARPRAGHFEAQLRFIGVDPVTFNVQSSTTNGLDAVHAGSPPANLTLKVSIRGRVMK